MTERAFVDSNVILYGYDSRHPAKRRRCQELLVKLVENQAAVISTQILQECFAVATRKLGMGPLEAKQILLDLAVIPLVQVTPDLIYEAIDGVLLYRIAFWDSLIVAAAGLAKCSVLYTEDLQHGQTIGGLRICNPFA